MALRYLDVKTGKELDLVTLTGESLTFATGTAGPLFAGWIDRYGLSDKAAYERMSGWSNGYAQLVEAE